MNAPNQAAPAAKQDPAKPAAKGKAQSKPNNLDYEALGLDPTVYGKKRKPKKSKGE